MLWRETALIRLFGLAKVPMIAYVGPRVIELDDEGCAVKIPLGWRTKNHVGSMYLGVLTVGADLASGLNAVRAVRNGHAGVVPLFKDFHSEYFKRADGDVVFRSRQGREVVAAVARAHETGERVTVPMQVTATVPEKYGDEPVARFTLSLSLKRQAEKR